MQLVRYCQERWSRKELCWWDRGGLCLGCCRMLAFYGSKAEGFPCAFCVVSRDYGRVCIAKSLFLHVGLDDRSTTTNKMVLPRTMNLFSSAEHPVV